MSPRRDHEAIRATARLSVYAAGVLIAIKLAAGLLSGSLALVAEAAHSGTDLAAALLTFAVIRVAIRPPDDDHPYGHGKAEHLAALGEGTFLFLVSGAVMAQAIRRLVTGEQHQIDTAWWLFAVLGLVVAVDITRVVVLRRAAARHQSPALAASALHFASDMAGTLAVIAGLILVAAGVQEADAVAAIVVALLVLWAAGNLMFENANVLMDRAPAGAERRVRNAIARAEPAAAVRRVRVRSAAGHHFAEVTVGYRADAALGESHAVADAIELSVERAIPGCDVIVHIEPETVDQDLRARVSAAALTVRGVREVHNVRVVTVDGRPELSLHVKLPAATDLARAHALASEVEAQIAGAVPEVSDVHVHLEPLADPARAAEPEAAIRDELTAAITALTVAATGAPPRRLALRDGDDGLVVLLTIALSGAPDLAAAHAQATELEHAVRARCPEVAAVVVHTEPADQAP